jgi:hypothetical protein
VVRKPKSTTRRIVNSDLAGDFNMTTNCNPDKAAGIYDRATTGHAPRLALEANTSEFRGREIRPELGGVGVGADELVGGTALRVDHVHHRVDQGQVGKGLREVAKVPAAPGVDLLCVQL